MLNYYYYCTVFWEWHKECVETGGICEEKQECLNPERTLILLFMAVSGPVEKMKN